MAKGSRISVAELAGKFACQAPLPTEDEANKPVRRRPPRTLPIPVSNDVGQGKDEQKAEAAPHPPRKNRNSALIEKLQGISHTSAIASGSSHPIGARPRSMRMVCVATSGRIFQRKDKPTPEPCHSTITLIMSRKGSRSASARASLSPTALLPSPLSPGAGKPQLPFFPPHSPSSPVSPTSASKTSQIETPASFEKPMEGSVLLSINKGRARHSIKRRPPSRRHRKSSTEEGGTEEEKATSPVSGPTTPDGTESDVFEKEKEAKEETDGTDSASATSKQQQDQEQHEALVDSKQQPLTSTEGEEESSECVVSAEKEEAVEEEKKSEEPELDSSKEESKKQEPDEEAAMETQSELAKATEDKIEQEVEKEEEVGGI